MENLENITNNPEINNNSTSDAAKEVKIETKAKVEETTKEVKTPAVESNTETKSTEKAPVAAAQSATTVSATIATATAAPERRPYPKPYVKPTRDSRPYTPRTGGDNRQGGFNNKPGGNASRPGFNKGGFNSKFGGPSKSKFGSKSNFKKPFDKNEVELFTEVITVKRVTRVVKGGKRMRFAALVVVGDKKGTIGFANRKGMDFQDAVAKATKKAKENMIKIKLNENFSLPFSTITKFKAAKILLKPANKGTSLIAGGFVRPVLQLAGIQNIYSKIQGSNNKVVGVEAVINALKNYV